MMTNDLSSAGELYYDPYDYEIDANAQALWRRMRDEAPVYWNDKYEFFALSRYDDVLNATLDTETFSSAHATVLEFMTAQPADVPLMIWMDPPRHSWHRKLVNRAFTVKTVARLEERVARLCNDLLDRVSGRDRFDFLNDYGAIIPPTVILALMGFPEGLVEDWRHGIDSMFHLEEGAQRPAALLDVSPEALGGSALISEGGAIGSGLYELLPEVLEERRREPKDDLLSVLVQTDLEEDGRLRKLNETEIFSFVTLLSVAGTETVARLLGWVAVLLDRHPDQRRRLVDDPALIPNAIEECLRYEAPSPVNGRWVTHEVAIHGRVMPKDSKVVLLNGSGNRDERHFPDPDRFDIDRKIDRHLSFGYGAHFCIGAALARIEGQIALREFLRRYPSWSVDYDEAEMVHTSTVRGYAKVPVEATTGPHG